ncbi:MAG TPA: DNA methyltransferase, partial [Pyrinomonadaceae bacterium]
MCEDKILDYDLKAIVSMKAHALLNSAKIPQTSLEAHKHGLDEINRLDRELWNCFEHKFLTQSFLTRSLVSFQANKNRATYRWYKYKEAFSASLVEYLLQRYKIVAGNILDPFAGSGTALFVASAMGLKAEGIEVLPIGQQLIATKKLLESDFPTDDIATLKSWSATHPWERSETNCYLPELRITKGAYPKQTLEAIGKYIETLKQENEHVQAVLRFALLCVLEAISYTRKDGQYLRWDHRSGRRQGQKTFHKGPILSFEKAICDKIDEIVFDLLNHSGATGLFPVANLQGGVYLYNGSCLEIMPTLSDGSYDAVLTSPPYCNRYDYTRTYALELALLGVDEQGLVNLRQQMLSCTVE